MRRRKAQEKEILADPKFNSKIVAKFINMVMTKGKKSIAERIVYRAFDIVSKQLAEPDAIKAFYKAIDNVRPRLEVKPRRVGGATYQVPIEVRQERGTSIALRWMPAPEKASPCRKNWPMKLSPLTRPKVPASRRETIRIRWPRLIKPLRTLGGKQKRWLEKYC
jgi:ribosomal protein S7